MEGPISTFRQSAGETILLSGAAPDGLALASLFAAADGRWRELLSTHSLTRLAFDSGLSQEKIGEIRDNAIAAFMETVR